MALDFKLPEKWYIKLDDDNRELVNKWKLNSEYPSDCYRHNYVIVEYDGCGIQEGEDGEDGSIEITTEQFIKYVLHKDIKVEEQDYHYLIGVLEKLNIK